MIYQKKTINNVPTKVPLSNSAPVGNPIGTIISTYKKIQPRNYLYCDGSTFDETIYPALYLYLGSNVLPDYRECAMVGAEKNTTDVFDSTETDPSTGLPGTQDHDVYAQGEFKDDQLQDHTHRVLGVYNSSGSAAQIIFQVGNSTNNWSKDTDVLRGNYRNGAVTRGKRKAVYYYIKAVDGVDISDEDSFLNTVKNYVDEKCAKFPDYTNPIKSGIDTSGWIATEDCYITINVGTSNHFLKIDNNTVQASSNSVLAFSGYVKKDSEIKLFENTTATSAIRFYAYPLV